MIMPRVCFFFSVIITATALAAAAQVVPGERLFLEAWRHAGCPDDAVVQDRMVDVRAFSRPGGPH